MDLRARAGAWFVPPKSGPATSTVVSTVRDHAKIPTAGAAEMAMRRMSVWWQRMNTDGSGDGEARIDRRRGDGKLLCECHTSASGPVQWRAADAGAARLVDADPEGCVGEVVDALLR
jgi:hypothetical protein